MTQGNRLVGDSAMLILKTIRNYGNLVDCQKGFLVTVFVLQGAVTLSVDVRVVVRLGCGVHVLCVLACGGGGREGRSVVDRSFRCVWLIRARVLFVPLFDVMFVFTIHVCIAPRSRKAGRACKSARGIR